MSVKYFTWFMKSRNKVDTVKGVDLTLIILGALSCGAYFYWEDYKNKKEIKKQERLNEIKTN